MDLTGVSMSTFSRKDMKYDGDIKNQMEECYPQLLESIKVCNAPRLTHVLWAVMPKHAVEKFDVTDPKKNEKERKMLYLPRKNCQWHLVAKTPYNPPTGNAASDAKLW